MYKGQLPSFVAVVDDEDDLVQLYKDALSQIRGIKVFAFTDSNLALEHFNINHDNYFLVISDFRMSGMNGIELLDLIRKTDPRVKRFLISAFEVEDFLVQNCGCVDKFLQKPIKITELIREVQMYSAIGEIMYPKI